MFNIPATGTAARDMMGDLTHVAELLHPDNRLNLPTFGQAVIRGRLYMASEKQASRISIVCYGNDNKRSQRGRILLISIGRKGGWRKEWDFGPAQ